MTRHDSARAQHRPRTEVHLSSPAELADALPYLMGFHPDDSVVVVAVYGERGRFGGRIRIGIPTSPEEWPALSTQIAACLETMGRSGSRRPDGAIVFLCMDPAAGETGQGVMERLQPLAQRLRTACGEREIPVFEALCLSAGRYWSYCCPDDRCCPLEGRPQAVPGTSPLAAAAVYAGLRVGGSLREMEARFTALGPPAADGQEDALDAASAALVPRMLGVENGVMVGEETLGLVGELITRFRDSVPDTGSPAADDAHDDALVSHEEAAAVILGVQDRATRDKSAEWMEGEDVGPALRLWRAMARRCVGPYAEHAAALLTLAGWVAWSGGDEPVARVAFGRALRMDPEYSFAQLLHRACNDGMDPEALRRELRKQRARRLAERPRDRQGGA